MYNKVVFLSILFHQIHTKHRHQLNKIRIRIVEVSVVIFGTVIFWHITWTRPHYYINIKIVQRRQAKSILITHKYMTGHFPGVATGTSIKSGEQTMDKKKARAFRV